MPRKPPKPDDPAESARFIETAKKLEVDETEEGAARAFKRVVQRPKPTRKDASKGGS